jgi:predicted house-cleaning noncanonical NTP pyrophosphatase (MazG superfamily)
MLEKRLTISLLVTDLNLLENILSERRSSLDRTKNCLGDSQYECSKLTEVNANLMIEAKDIRDQALRVVKATEQLVLTKGYMEDDYKCKAYKLLELATEYLEEITRREHLLDAAMKFFESAEKVMGPDKDYQPFGWFVLISKNIYYYFHARFRYFEHGKRYFNIRRMKSWQRKTHTLRRR